MKFTLFFFRLPIHDCITFITPCFQAPLTNIFLHTLFWSNIIESFDITSSLPNTLKWDSELGMHTDIMYFSFYHSLPPIMSMMCDKYVWWNANIQPYGHNVPFLCPTCASVWPWGKTAKVERDWVVQCSNPNCGLNANKSQLRLMATVSEEKAANAIFVTPKKRADGWFLFRVSNLSVLSISFVIMFVILSMIRSQLNLRSGIYDRSHLNRIYNMILDPFLMLPHFLLTSLISCHCTSWTASHYRHVLLM